MRWMVLEIVGWETPNASARSSSVRLWRRVRRVVFRAWFRLKARGLVAGLFQVRFFVQGCGEGGELCVGERRLCAGDATVFSGVV